MSHDCLKKLKRRQNEVFTSGSAKWGWENCLEDFKKDERIQRMEEIEEETGAGQIQKRKSSHVPVFALCQGTQLKFSHTNLN